MARPRINNGKSNVGLYPETIAKIQEIAQAMKCRDQVSRTYPSVVTELVNKAYEQIVATNENN